MDAKLAYSRHYPSINWMESYSGYTNDVATWWHENVDESWNAVRQRNAHILQKEDTLKEIVKLLVLMRSRTKRNLYWKWPG